ncbi:MAG: hypothetical protein ACYSR5_11875, partial [Planctomycetota bacterium]
PDDICALRDSAVVYLAMGRLTDAAKRIAKARSLASDDFRLTALDRRVRLACAVERLCDSLLCLRPRFTRRKSHR